jgi:two-component system chemotaxis response regulator CheY
MKKSILIVDDSAPLRMLLEAMLQKKYKVYTANDGLSALMWLTNGNIPDLIITDMQMPNINGTEFINILNSNILYSDIPVLILTGNKIQDEILVGQNVVSVLDLLQVDRAVV